MNEQPNSSIQFVQGRRALPNTGLFETASAKWPRLSIGHKKAQFELGIF